jgi:hypothetical protein
VNTPIKERPILFSAPMVRAILEGRKTVTRRAVKGHQIPTKDPDEELEFRWSAVAQKHPRYGFAVSGETPEACAAELALYSPYGRRGERLWVRETFIDLRGTGIEHRPDPEGPLQRYAYAADYRPGSHSDETRKDFGLKHKPSIHMPRAACRILLEITDVRVERLQDISEVQAEAEGAEAQAIESFRATGIGRPAGFAFRDIWTSINGASAWDANPWVWVVEFKRVSP